MSGASVTYVALFGHHERRRSERHRRRRGIRGRSERVQGDRPHAGKEWLNGVGMGRCFMPPSRSRPHGAWRGSAASGLASGPAA